MGRTAQWCLSSLYLGAAVVANLSVAAFGQAALPFTAFLLIPFDLVVRDVLHERWEGPQLLTRMALLVGLGSALSFLVNANAWRVALASMLAFGTAGTVDTIVYHVVRRRSRFARMNLSNSCSAVVDSIVFPLVAFGSANAWLSASQAGAKFVGGIFWSAIFIALLRRSHVRA